jgi:hypothetical protein
VVLLSKRPAETLRQLAWLWRCICICSTEIGCTGGLQKATLTHLLLSVVFAKTFRSYTGLEGAVQRNHLSVSASAVVRHCCARQRSFIDPTRSAMRTLRLWSLQHAAKPGSMHDSSPVLLT